LARAQKCYNWDAVADQYETLFQQILLAARTA
jgi:hypothetical protein